MSPLARAACLRCTSVLHVITASACNHSATRTLKWPSKSNDDEDYEKYLNRRLRSDSRQHLKQLHDKYPKAGRKDTQQRPYHHRPQNHSGGSSSYERSAKPASKSHHRITQHHNQHYAHHKRQHKPHVQSYEERVYGRGLSSFFTNRQKRLQDRDSDTWVYATLHTPRTRTTPHRSASKHTHKKAKTNQNKAGHHRTDSSARQHIWHGAPWWWAQHGAFVEEGDEEDQEGFDEWEEEVEFEEGRWEGVNFWRVRGHWQGQRGGYQGWRGYFEEMEQMEREWFQQYQQRNTQHQRTTHRAQWHWRQQASGGAHCTGGLCSELQGHLQALGLPRDSAPDHKSLKAAFHKSARQWHPDMHQDAASKAEAEQRFKTVQHAYQQLLVKLPGS